MIHSSNEDVKECKITAEEIAERILKASGSGLHHYMLSSRERIIAEADSILKEIRK